MVKTTIETNLIQLNLQKMECMHKHIKILQGKLFAGAETCNPDVSSAMP